MREAAVKRALGPEQSGVLDQLGGPNVMISFVPVLCSVRSEANAGSRQCDARDRSLVGRFGEKASCFETAKKPNSSGDAARYVTFPTQHER
jgi:hypothetical protein